MQESITKALLFVIAFSTSIIAVELIPQHRVNNAKLLCAEYNASKVGEFKGKNRTINNKNFAKLIKMTKSNDPANVLLSSNEFLLKIENYCTSLDK